MVVFFFWEFGVVSAGVVGWSRVVDNYKVRYAVRVAAVIGDAG